MPRGRYAAPASTADSVTPVQGFLVHIRSVRGQIRGRARVHKHARIFRSRPVQQGLIQIGSNKLHLLAHQKFHIFGQKILGKGPVALVAQLRIGLKHCLAGRPGMVHRHGIRLARKIPGSREARQTSPNDRYAEALGRQGQGAGLRANRMQHQWLALEWGAEGEVPPDLLANPVALPFASGSLDLVVLPHTLELSIDPHAALREVERVLVPEGRVVIAGLNPASLWGLRQCAGQWAERWGLTPPASDHLFVPETGDWIAPWRLRDWLRLLGLETESTQTGAYRWPAHTAHWLERGAWLDQCGPRLWRVLGAAYFVVAVKRVRGMHLLGPAWKPRRALGPLPVAVARHPPPRTPGASPRTPSE